jgi:arylsulfatase A
VQCRSGGTYFNKFLEAPKELVAKYKARYTGDLNPTYCAMVETLDTSFGQIMAALDQSGERERTIVFFFSDNGGLKLQGKLPKPITDNTPLRAGKGFLYEGGIREPLMVRWPGTTKPGTICRVPVCSVDFMPTFAEMIGVPARSGDGISLCPLLAGGSLPERPLFWHYPHYHGAGGTPSGAIREGEWKLIEFFEDNRLELFHLWQDLGERRNMITREPDRAKQMHAKLVEWRESVNASMPKENPAYDARLADRGMSGTELPTPRF